jgi:5-formyltetrahydrofolate cyclo-ligase
VLVSAGEHRIVNPTEEKRVLRRATLGRIRALTAAERSRQEQILNGCFRKIPGLASASTVLLYASAFPEEIDTRPWLDLCLGQSKRLVLPRVDRALGRLVLHAIEDPDRDLRPGRMNIPEPVPDRPLVAPQAIDWALVPGVAFDRRCNRLGRGGGYYDRLLAQLRPEAPFWAIAYSEQIYDRIFTELHDVSLHGIVHPAGVLLPAGEIPRQAGA